MTATDEYVLVVEDDDDVRGALAAYLEGEGHRVVEAADGGEALAQLRASGAPCVILLDLFMPRVNGWQFRAEQVRDAALARIPVVVISADPAVAKNAAELGVDGHLAKPVDFDRLREYVNRFC